LIYPKNPDIVEQLREWFNYKVDGQLKSKGERGWEKDLKLLILVNKMSY